MSSGWRADRSADAVSVSVGRSRHIRLLHNIFFGTTGMRLLLIAFVFLPAAVLASDLGVCHADCTRSCYGVGHQCGDEDGVETYFEHCCSCDDGAWDVGDRWNECLPGTRIEAEYRCVAIDDRDPYQGMPEFTGSAVYDSENCECDTGDTRCIEEGEPIYQQCSSAWRWENRECDQEEVCSSATGTVQCVRDCDFKSWCVDRANRQYVTEDCKTRMEACPNGCITDNGKGVCRNLYVWPTPSSGTGKITSCPHDLVCVNGICQWHAGAIDIAGNKGDQVLAITTGRVAVAQAGTKYGTMIILDHYDGWASLYAHLDELKVSEGQNVHVGDQIATLDSTGPRTTGNHLHLELRRGIYGSLENPCSHTDCGGRCKSTPGPRGGAPERLNIEIAEQCKASCIGGSGKPLGNRRDLCTGYAKYKSYIDRAAAQFGLEKAALLAVASAESDIAQYYDDGSVKKSGAAYGIMQLGIDSAARICAMRGWISDANAVKTSPEENINCGAGYFAEKLHNCGTMARAYGGYRQPASRCSAELGQKIIWFYDGWKQCLRSMNDADTVLAGFSDELHGYKNQAEGIKNQIAELLAQELSPEERALWRQTEADMTDIIALIDADIAYIESRPSSEEAASAVPQMRNEIIGRMSI